jgi:flagellar basal-body rod modification protein FlgD
MTTTATTAAAAAGSASTAQAAGNTAMQQIAGNFDSFLQLLTTQLQNQNPLDPLDTNQFTQELVEFASVGQQVNMNSNMQTLISLQQTTAATAALQLVGSNVTVAGQAASLSNATGSPATWSISAAAPATANVTITSATGQTAYTGALALNSGSQSFTWSGQGSNGVTWPDGNYTISISATGANGQPVSISTQVRAWSPPWTSARRRLSSPLAGRRCRSAKSNRSAADYPRTIPRYERLRTPAMPP